MGPDQNEEATAAAAPSALQRALDIQGEQLEKLAALITLAGERLSSVIAATPEGDKPMDTNAQGRSSVVVQIDKYTHGICVLQRRVQEMLSGLEV
ncbi:MAG TPA: hypothetical protein VLH38_00470 [Patescibacteria group bacterium]|nr:hypothetical protein [Patescibacteria group bacterium]